MPTLTRRFIKAGLAFLVLALVLALAAALAGARGAGTWRALLAPLWLHAFMLGFVAQLIFGVVYWMFPTYTRESPRGHEGLWRFCFWALNLGLVLRLLTEPLVALAPSRAASALLALAAGLLLAAGMAFAANAWLRLRER